MTEHEYCNPNYANSGVLSLSRRSKRELAVKELENVILGLQHDDDYLPLYRQIYERLGHESNK